MGFFSFGKDKVKEQVNLFSGNKDFMEGLCAATARTAAADGEIDDKEYDKTINVIKSIEGMSAAFGTAEIEKCFERMAAKTKTRMGKRELMTEIEQVIKRDKTGKMAEAILLTALDVADEGGISSEEEKVLREVAGACGLNYDKYK